MFCQPWPGMQMSSMQRKTCKSARRSGSEPRVQRHQFSLCHAVAAVPQGKAAAVAEYGNQTPAQNSIVHLLARSSDKTTGASLTEMQIVAQSYTFMLAGMLPLVSTGVPFICPILCPSEQAALAAEDESA